MIVKKKTRNDVLKIAALIARKTNGYPTQLQLEAAGVTRAVVRLHFGKLESLLDVLYPSIQDKIFDLSRASYKTEVSKSTKRFVVTTAVTGHKVNSNFLKNIQNYCKKNKAELIIIPSLGIKGLHLDPSLEDSVIVTKAMRLNSNCSILPVQTKATSGDSVAGLAGVGQRNGSFIVGATKQRLKYVAAGRNKMPHALIGTGSITDPNYFTGMLRGDLFNKTNFIADHNHKLGAMIVEIENSEIYHFRNITTVNGNFVDLGEYFYDGKVGTMAPSHIAMGDWHSGKTCPVVKKATVNLVTSLGIKNIVGHDVFDGDSVTHHDQGKEGILAKKANQGRLSLEAELRGYLEDLKFLSSLAKLHIVKSNHDEHLERYLYEARYVKQPHNHQLGLKLANAFIDGSNPLEYYCKVLRKEALPNVKFLKRDEDFVVAGIQLGAHGDKGANGSRASIAQMESSFGNVVYGHSHTPEILRGAYCVGTSTARKPDYGDGPSSWMNTHCLIYPDGSRQLVNLIEGKFTTKKL